VSYNEKKNLRVFGVVAPLCISQEGANCLTKNNIQIQYNCLLSYNKKSVVLDLYVMFDLIISTLLSLGVFFFNILLTVHLNIFIS